MRCYVHLAFANLLGADQLFRWRVHDLLNDRFYHFRGNLRSGQGREAQITGGCVTVWADSPAVDEGEAPAGSRTRSLLTRSTTRRAITWSMNRSDCSVYSASKHLTITDVSPQMRDPFMPPSPFARCDFAKRPKRIARTPIGHFAGRLRRSSPSSARQPWTAGRRYRRNPRKSSARRLNGSNILPLDKPGFAVGNRVVLRRV